MPLLVGTSGWQYRSWKGVLYPSDVPQKRWLEHFAANFATVENNNAFYRLPPHETFAAWRQRTPEGFIMAVKASRFLTHIKRLKDPEEPVQRLMDAASGLRERLGPVLVQLPPSFKVDLDRLSTCLARFPSHVRVAVEPRHGSWWTEEVKALLTKHGAALCWADRLGSPITPLWRTADWGYLRLHQGRATPWPRYGRQALTSWVERIADTFAADTDVYVYFNNDPGGAAIHDATHFAEIARQRGHTPSRTPDPAALR